MIYILHCISNPQKNVTAQESSANPQPEPSHHSSPINLQLQPSESDYIEESTRPGTSHVISSPAPSNIFRCRFCNSAFSNRRELYVHPIRYHNQTGGGVLQLLPYAHGLEPWIGNDSQKEIYDTNRPLILQRHREGTVYYIQRTPDQLHFHKRSHLYGGNGVNTTLSVYICSVV